MSRAAILPREMLGNVCPIYSQQVGIKGKLLCLVVLSDEGLLAERVAKETGLVFNPMDFAVGVVDPRRSIRSNNLSH